jgi:hypothetical protein
VFGIGNDCRATGQEVPLAATSSPSAVLQNGYNATGPAGHEASFQQCFFAAIGDVRIQHGQSSK